MRLTEQQAAVVIGLLTSSVDLIDQEIKSTIDVIGRTGELSLQEQDEFCRAMARLESYSACIVLLSSYLPDDDAKEKLLELAKANLRQAKHFFDETEISYGVYVLQPNGIN